MIESLGAWRALVVALVVVGCAAVPAVEADPGPVGLERRLDRSLAVLRHGAQFSPRPAIKTGIMVGVGETITELTELMHQVSAAGVDILTIGQYLRPSLACQLKTPH